jgi:hypothetical protein
MKEAILVLGYNNTRINDVRKIREKANQSLGAITVLCKKDPTEIDKSAVDFAIDVGLEQSDENIQTIINTCKENDTKIIGILPFSDQGTQLGALLAQRLNLPGALPEKINAALNKHEFRAKEKELNKPQGYIAVNAKKITSLEELQTTFQEFDSALFLKPMSEGNSRGCIAIKKYEDCESAWNEVKKYLSGGITAEKLIENAQEYSWEHVAGYSWITEKMTTQSQYRAEPQHILPAPISKAEADVLTAGAKFMAELSGYNGCPCHNEIFLLNSKTEVMAVEPNLRPAGGKLWDLSTYAFENFDPWVLWINWATGKVDSTSKPLKQKCFAGMRFIIARRDGKIKNIALSDLAQLSEKAPGNYIELVWTKKAGDMVTSCPHDNADFLGYVTATSDDYNSLAAKLLEAEELLAKSCLIED